MSPALIVALVLLVLVGAGLYFFLGRRGRFRDRPGRAGVLSRRWLMEHDRDEEL